jgi:hypothetical protein
LEAQYGQPFAAERRTFCLRGLNMTTALGVARSRMAFCTIALAFLSAGVLLVTVSSAKTPLAPWRQQEVEKKAPPLRWDPPRVDDPISSLSATPPCSLPDVLKQAGQRAEELVDHLQKFIAREQVRYQQTDRQGAPEIYLAPKFEYLVDFGKTFEPLHVHETRTPLAGTEDEPLSSILDKGLPVLALIFHPSLQGDYEMSCEGATLWNHQPAWVVHFRQMRGKRPRTLTMETPVEVYPRLLTATELRPLSIKGRAWIAADSGQVMHLETNLVGPILMIDLSEVATSVDYAPVKSHSLNLEIWLPQYAVAYTDFAQRRMIIEHTFSDFQLFSVETRETIRQPKVP